MSEKKDERGVLFVYAEPRNETHVNKLSKKYNIPKSEVVNRILESHRTGNPPVFNTKIPKYVERASQWVNRNKNENTEE